MQFHHVSIKGNYPLTASYCTACLSFVGVSSHEGLLKQPEQEHRCPARKTAEAEAADPGSDQLTEGEQKNAA
jgi:hypothetical protein